MEHSVTAEGFGVRLRPVRMEDAPFIVWLRNLAHARAQLGDTGDEASQRAWLERYFRRAGDYYFIIEAAGGQPVGTHGIYDCRGGSAELGRWVVRPDVWAAVPSYLLAFRTAFETLALGELRMTTAVTNRPVLSLSRKLGFRRTGVATNARLIDGVPVDIVHFLVEAGEWPRVCEQLAPLARLAEMQVRAWEKRQAACVGESARNGAGAA